MASGGNLYQREIQPFPMPEAPKQQAPQEQSREMSPPPQMPAVYYGGNAGKAAFLADNILKGWLAGTRMGHERKQNQMTNEINSARTAVDYLGQAYRAAVDSGDKTKIDETSKALKQAWSDYLDKAQKYALPEDMDKTGKKGGGVKAGLKRALMGGESPHLNIGLSTLAVLRKTDPTTIYGQSKKEQLDIKKSEQDIERGKQQLEIGEQVQEQNKLTIEQEKRLKDLQDEYQKAVASHNSQAEDDLARQITALTGRKIEPAAKQQIERKTAETALGAMDKLQKGEVKSFDGLSDLEQAALVGSGLAVQAKNGLQAYLKEVGPGKRFKTEYDAAHQWNIDSHISRVMGMKPTPMEEIMDNERIILGHDLQNPQVAAKYGIQALQPGQKPPEWLVRKQASERYRASPEEKADAKVWSDMAQKRIIHNALTTFNPVEQEQIKAMFLSEDPELGTLTLNQEPNLRGVPAEKVRPLYEAFRKRFVNWAKQMYPNASDETIEQIVGPVPNVMTREVTPPPGTRELSSPPQARDIDKMPTPKRYKVKTKSGYLYGGQSIELSPDDLKKIKQNPAYTLEETQ